MTSVKFLYFVISVEGVKVVPAKIKAVCDISPHNNKTDKRRLLRMVTYLNKFSPRLAVFCFNIHLVTRAKAEWFWSPKQQSFFENIKRELFNTPVLCAFDVARLHRISADASRDALGADMLQQTVSIDWQPVEYASQKLTEME